MRGGRMKYTLAIETEWHWRPLGNFNTLKSAESFLGIWFKKNKKEMYKYDSAYIFYNKKPKVIRIECDK
jgi:hypothetical protein